MPAEPVIEALQFASYMGHNRRPGCKKGSQITRRKHC
jgi:hypothetical protein